MEHERPRVHSMLREDDSGVPALWVPVAAAAPRDPLHQNLQGQTRPVDLLKHSKTGWLLLLLLLRFTPRDAAKLVRYYYYCEVYPKGRSKCVER